MILAEKEIACFVGYYFTYPVSWNMDMVMIQLQSCRQKHLSLGDGWLSDNDPLSLGSGSSSVIMMESVNIPVLEK